MKKALNVKIIAAVLMAVIALAALGLVLGIVFSDNIAAAETEQVQDAADGTDQPADEGSDAVSETSADNSQGLIAIAAAIAVGLAAAAGAIGMGIAIAKSNESIARQPEAKNDIRSSMMLGLVFIETAIIYALIIAILLIFVL